MTQQTVRVVVSMLVGLIGPFFIWLGGYDFDARGALAVVSFGSYLMASIGCYTYPGWRLD